MCEAPPGADDEPELEPLGLSGEADRRCPLDPTYRKLMVERMRSAPRVSTAQAGHREEQEVKRRQPHNVLCSRTLPVADAAGVLLLSGWSNGLARLTPATAVGFEPLAACCVERPGDRSTRRVVVRAAANGLANDERELELEASREDELAGDGILEGLPCPALAVARHDKGV